MTGVPTAAWSLDRLMVKLARSGWGDELDGPALAGVRRVLQALSDLLPWEAAEGRLTRAQVADAAGMSPKWAGVCLARLERLGLISWSRGWLDKGRPRAGWIRVHKQRLAEIVRGVRGYLDERRKQRRQSTADRINNTLRNHSVPPWRRRETRSGHMGSEFHPSHSRKYGAPAPGRPSPSQTLPEGTQDMPRCTVCGQIEDTCRRMNQKVPYALSHQFVPGTSRAQTLIAQAEELRRPRPRKHRGGWRDLVAKVTPPAIDPLDGL
ncbi:MAG: hypothetical protein QM582_14025 [Micropruina sp.]|uniref:hypothetical protein n=1 Tax=Micropruina sp. TaxID=2737536 RepID=UPI0039E40615